MIALRKMFPSCIALAICGGASVVANFILIHITLLQKRETNNFRWNMFQLGMAHFLIGAGSLWIGGDRLYRLYNQIGEVRTPLSCCLQLVVFDIGIVSSIGMTFTMALDRCLAVMSPVFYHTKVTITRFQLLINSATWLICIAFPTWGAVRNLQSVEFISVCSMVTAFTPFYCHLYIYVMLIMSLMIVFMYLAILISVKVRLAKVRKQEGDLRKVKIELETKVLSIVGWIVVVYFFSSLCTLMGAQLATILVGADESRIIVAYFSVVAACNSASNLPFYLWKSDSIREDFVKIYGLAKCRTKVLPIESNLNGL